MDKEQTIIDSGLPAHTSIPIGATTTTTLMNQQTTVGRVTGVRLSSATSDGTASPLSYLGGSATPVVVAATSASVSQKLNNTNVINSSCSNSVTPAATVDNHHLQPQHSTPTSTTSATTSTSNEKHSTTTTIVVDNDEPLIKIKEEHLDDYERLIDNVNSDRLSKNLSSSSVRDLASLRKNSSSSSVNVPTTPASSTHVSFTNEFV